MGSVKTVLILMCLAACVCGCRGTEITRRADLRRVVRLPDEYYLSSVEVTGITGLPVYMGRRFRSGVYKLWALEVDEFMLVQTPVLPGPGIRVRVSGRVTMDPATSRTMLIEVSRRKG